ncbi:MAG: hypothetical protein A3G02_00685 [Candidatus Yanofskybacteria bacterium RIFCSPLOWO2_12_FULL_44_13b]|uniref:Outer membrane protein beta-barrel domain-containing protein n=3 Tax=Patescibacteria group TaxID=1783273 RepID=A0A0G1LPW0_9BACT|nr:MAG: hypothetical protein UW14_C0022G0003 [Candidatus Yanofskybacteria bacterium GW2011_GWA2_44_10]KKT34276.1 MAG: hypothetical protein UW22_C0082G0002 [Candidatus Gottesmanbacteria bacterium GW2011_GWB1_44_11c]KKT61934.1 MAG: hypothetical protein UW57_C0025G0003 [Candidatus Giovannonibacteria bacterium GW2011_GWA1_44_29]OGN14085.1 MAG: hypothetical protein A3C01_00580 [Candidatus Yanofskybacteria bacterium RIFCSPHIGHO2_02_FULL_44_36b]OGN18790.1 MAG: hypothetical protein A3F50_02705 [Candida
MIKALATMIALLATVGNAVAQEVTLSANAKEIYLGANGAVFYDGFVPETDVFISWKNGVYADIWTSTALNFRRDFDKEVDVTVGKAGKFHGFDYAVDGSYFIIVITDVITTSIELSRSVEINPRLTLAPYIRAEAYGPVRKGGPPRGIMGIAGLRGSVTIVPRLSISYRGLLKKDTGCFGFDSAVMGQGYVGIPIRLTSRLNITPGVSFSAPISRVRDGRKQEAVWEIGFSRRF